jgi:AGCS family alanine or glycine:cation symporter
VNFLENVVGVLNNFIWSYILIGLLIILGLYFTIKCDFVQFKLLKDMFKLLGEGTRKKGSKSTTSGISAFQAFCISTASRVGTGNLAGVAIAIAIGGPGAVFWMWVVALVGGASAFVESTLAQIYKVKDGDNYRGGPAYYMEKALGMRWLGVIFSILISISFGLVFNSVQSNTISFAFEKAFNINRIYIGIILSVMTAVIIFGGIKRIAKVVELIVPVMAIAYIVIVLFVIVKNISIIPSIISSIFANALGIRQAIGGGIGVVVMQGIKRGLFSNEAGMGSAPNAAASAEATHPVKQGLVQTLSVFVDTLVICSATAFLILASGVHMTSDSNGIQLTQDALISQVGPWGSVFIAVCIFLFAFSSVVGNYYYGETNIEFINSNKAWMFIYRCLVVAMVMFGCVSKVQVVWDMADLFMGFMSILNLVVITMLAKTVVSVMKDYIKQKKKGEDPVFKSSSIEGLTNTDCWED